MHEEMIDRFYTKFKNMMKVHTVVNCHNLRSYHNSYSDLLLITVKEEYRRFSPANIPICALMVMPGTKPLVASMYQILNQTMNAGNL